MHVRTAPGTARACDGAYNRKTPRWSERLAMRPSRVQRVYRRGILVLCAVGLLCCLVLGAGSAGLVVLTTAAASSNVAPAAAVASVVHSPAPAASVVRSPAAAASAARILHAADTREANASTLPAKALRHRAPARQRL